VFSLRCCNEKAKWAVWRVLGVQQLSKNLAELPKQAESG